jgi:hypothetical protein
MPSLKELFNPTVLMFLGILLIVVAGLVVYIESKMREQNHKITSMLSIVSSLAEELNSVKFRLNNTMSSGSGAGSGSGSGAGSGAGSGSGSRNGITSDDSLVTVSDYDGDCDSDDDLESLEDEDEDEEDSGSDDDISNNVIDITEQKNIKILTLTVNNKDGFVIEELDDSEEDSMIEELDDDNSIQSIEEKEPEIVESEKLFDLKSINISNLEESTQNNELNDLKKQPVNKLRSIVIEKGLSTDPSKLKKPELLKLLGIE